MTETPESRIDELERKMDIMFKYLVAHDAMFKSINKETDAIIDFCKLNKEKIDLMTKVLTNK